MCSQSGEPCYIMRRGTQITAVHWCIAIYTCPLPQPYAAVDSEAATGTWHHVASHGTREALLPFARSTKNSLTVLSGSFAQKVGGAWELEYRRSIGLTQRGRSSTEAWKCRDGGETHTCTDDKSERVILHTSKERFHFANTLSLSLSLINMEIHSSLARVLSFKCSRCSSFGFEEVLLHVPLQLLQPGQTHPQQMQIMFFYMHALEFQS